MRLGSGVAVAGGYSSNSTPNLSQGSCQSGREVGRRVQGPLFHAFVYKGLEHPQSWVSGVEVGPRCCPLWILRPVIQFSDMEGEVPSGPLGVSRSISFLLSFSSLPFLPFSPLFSVSFPCFTLFFFFRAKPAAYGSSQAKGPIRAAAASLHHSHSNRESEPHL